MLKIKAGVAVHIKYIHSYIFLIYINSFSGNVLSSIDINNYILKNIRARATQFRTHIRIGTPHRLSLFQTDSLYYKSWRLKIF